MICGACDAWVGACDRSASCPCPQRQGTCRCLVRRKHQEKKEELLTAGDHLAFEDGSLWQVTSSNLSGARVLCLTNGERHQTGEATTICSARETARLVVGEALIRMTSKAERATITCETCRVAADGGEACREHVRAPTTRTRRGSFQPTPEEVRQVQRLRREGLGYHAIEDVMGWPDSHGNRPWKIVKDHGLGEEVAPTS